MDKRLLFRNKVIPLYYQLETILRKSILSAEMAPGDALPSEEAFTREYGVSRITVRQALFSLERDGLIVRKRGKGTFVTKKRIFIDPLKFSGSIEDLTCIGIKTSTKVIDFRVTRVPESVMDHLKLPQSADVVRIERLRLAEAFPYCYVLNYLPLNIGQKIQPDALNVKPLLKILEDDLGVYLAAAVQTFEAIIADTQVASLLEVRVGEPLLKIERTIFDADRKPIEWVSIVYRADKYLFRINLKREKTSYSTNWNLDY